MDLRVYRAPKFELSYVAFLVVLLAGSWIEVENPGQKLASIWDAAITDRGLIYYAMPCLTLDMTYVGCFK